MDICIHTNTEFVQMKHTVVQSPARKAIFFGPKPSIFSVCGGKERELIVQRNKRKRERVVGGSSAMKKQKFCWYCTVLGLIKRQTRRISVIIQSCMCSYCGVSLCFPCLGFPPIFLIHLINSSIIGLSSCKKTLHESYVQATFYNP